MHYSNPILMADYSDPDVIRVGEDFYMISSSFTYLPGIPVLRSRDLVHWEIIGHAAAMLPFPRYDRPAHRCGTWAPSIRWHRGLFYVYVCLPDEGLLCFTAQDPAGEWECHYVKDVTGWIDPCPLFDEDGQAYLVHAEAASRAGIANLLFLHRMSPDGLRILDKGRIVYDGSAHGDTTVEGPKMYKREGRYWILCPAGGVETGYQLALRSDSIDGPYERRVVLSQGDSPVNGPHQGGLVDDGRGGEWFIHFQDRGPYGRVTHLESVDWSDGWPVMGEGGTPALEGEVPLPPAPAGIAASDDFGEGIGLQWQWQANPRASWYRALKPGLRLYAEPAESLFEAGNFLSQLMQHRDFDMDTSLRLHPKDGDAAGIGMMGYGYTCICLERGRVKMKTGTAVPVSRWVKERVTEQVAAEAEKGGDSVFFRMRVRCGRVSFLYGDGAEDLHPLGGEYPLTCGGWTAARPGIFCINTEGFRGGWADFAFVSVTPAPSDP